MGDNNNNAGSAAPAVDGGSNNNNNLADFYENPYVGGEGVSDLTMEAEQIDVNGGSGADGDSDAGVAGADPGVDAGSDTGRASAREKPPVEAQAPDLDAKEGDASVTPAAVTTPIQVPKNRLDAEIAKRRELEARIAELEGRNAPDLPVVNGISDLVDPKAMFDKVLDGDLDAAGSAFTQAMQAVADATAASVAERLTPRIDQAPQVTKDQMELDAKANELVTTYKVLDPQSDMFDETLQNEVLDLRDMYIGKGYRPAAALDKAAKMLMTSEGIEAAKEANAPPKPRTLERRIAAAGAQAASTAQPPVTEASSVEEAPFDIESMTEADLDRLSAEQLARLRGDFL